MRKVVVVLPEMESGGGQKVALDIVKNIHDTELDIQVLCLYPRMGYQLEEFAEKAGISVYYLNKHKGMDLSIIPQINHALKELKPDVIHAHLRVMPYLILPLLFSKAKYRYYTVHNLADKDAEGANRKALTFAFRHAGVVPVAISDLCKRSILETYKLNAKDVPCIYNGIDIERFQNQDEYDAGTNANIRFIATGRLMESKNYPMMLHCFANVCKQYKNARLTILGGGYLKDELEALCGELGIDKNVSFKGIVKNVEEYLHHSNVYLMSSGWEGLPLALLEAMAAGLPIIATKAGGIVDVMTDGRNGYLVDTDDEAAYTDAMLKMIENAPLRKKFSSNNITDSKKYSITACASAYATLYKK